MTALLDEVTGSDAWVTNLSPLGSYLDTADDSVLGRLAKIRHENKIGFAAQVKEREGIDIDPDAIFDVQIKRLHEYKRRLLNALYILGLYFRMKKGPSLDIPKRVFVFGTKAASGYIRAKDVVKLINTIAELVNNDEGIAGRIKAVFIHSYNVSPAEHIIPTAGVSEQISTTGKGTSDTSNMRFMMNGALTLSTLGGAGVEILDAAGEDNAYIFGATEDELPELHRNYDPRWHYENIPSLRYILDALVDGTLDSNGSGWFRNLRWLLLESGYEPTDVYYVLGDFAAYREAKDRMAADHADMRAQTRKAWVNITKPDHFSSDHAVHDYAEDVWKLEATPID